MMFWKDKDGFTKEDFEKLTTGFLFIIGVLVVLYKYLIENETNTNMIYLVTILGSLFVVRKGISYFKPNRYYRYNFEDESPNEFVDSENQI